MIPPTPGENYGRGSSASWDSMDKLAMAEPSSSQLSPKLVPENFDLKGYLELNPDVAKARWDPGLHYLTHGWKEGRRWRVDDQAYYHQRAEGMPATDTARDNTIKPVRSDSADLVRLAKKHGVDKWGEHWYISHYESHFNADRLKKLTLLEIGVGGYELPAEGGRSLRMWEEYFPNAIIYGVDVYDKKVHERNRVRIRQGSQTDEIFLLDLAEEAQGFDIIIDDGSHVNDHIIRSFLVLFPSLKQDGWYVIEDLQTSYWPSYGGSSGDIRKADTAVEFLKTLVDCLNHEEMIKPGYKPSYLDTHVKEIHFYHNIVFIKKGCNTEGSSHLLNNVPFKTL